VWLLWVQQGLAVQFQRSEFGVDEAFDLAEADADLVVVPEFLALREGELGEVRAARDPGPLSVMISRRLEAKTRE
jgi:hypothetical protein